MKTKSRHERISAELSRLQGLFSSLPPNELSFVRPMLENAAFMVVTLADLQEEINADGAVDEYQNGAAQFGRKASASIQAYNATCKTFTALMDRLMAKLPKEQRTSALAALRDGGGE